MQAEHYNNLPEDVKAIIDSFDESAEMYSECKRIQQELRAIDWDCDYDLSGEITEVWKMDENMTADQIKISFDCDTAKSVQEIRGLISRLQHNCNQMMNSGQLEPREFANYGRIDNEIFKIGLSLDELEELTRKQP